VKEGMRMNKSNRITRFVISACLATSLVHAKRPGDQDPIGRVHPGYILENIKPASVNYSIGAMDFLSDGSLVIASWKDPYGIFILKNATGPKENIAVTEFAIGLSEVLGLKVVDDRIYVMQKDELTWLEDTDGDGKADEYHTIACDWTKSVMEKEYAVGLSWDGKYFYSAFGDPTRNAGEAVDPAPAGRQNGVLKMSLDGTVAPFSGGMRVPGGTEFALGEIWATENEGGFRSSNALYAIRSQRWYGRPLNPPSVFQPIPYRKFPDDGPHKPLFSPPAIWMPYGDVGGFSPGNPLYIAQGDYRGQLLVGDATNVYGGMSRAFVENVQGEWQGAIMHFCQGFDQHNVYRAVTGPDGAIYAAGHGGSKSSWDRSNTFKGLYRLKPSGRTVFDILAVRSLGPKAFEIEFTKPLDAALGADVASRLEVKKWWERPNEKYGDGDHTDVTALTVNSARVSEDRKKVIADIGDLSEGWVVYFHFTGDALSSEGEKLWGTEAWYTLNHFGPAVTPSTATQGMQEIAPGSIPFHLEQNPAGDLRVRMALPDESPFTILVVDPQGRTHVTYAGRGRSEFVLTRGQVPPGLYVLKVRAGGRDFSRLVSRE
jgi:hypothetical protein